MSEARAANNTDERADLDQVAVVRAVAARAARRVRRRSVATNAMASAVVVLGAGVVVTRVPGWPIWLVVAATGAILAEWVADRAATSGPVKARSALRVSFVTAGLTAGVLLAVSQVVDMGNADIWAYLIAATVILAVGGVVAWWVGR